MNTQVNDARRIRLQKIFHENNYKSVLAPKGSSKKSDEFQHDTSGFLYFFWTQGKDIDIAIDPRIKYSEILKLGGVSLKKTNLPLGLRHGSSMKAFPKEYESSIPKDSGSRVGRMFVVQEGSLQSFLKGLTLPSQNGVERGSSAVLISESNASLEERPDLNVGASLPKDSIDSIGQSSNLIVPTLHVEPSSDKERHSLISAGVQIALESETRSLNTAEREAVVKVRFGQGDFRNALLKEGGERCWMTGIEGKRLLVASHIKPWSHCQTDIDSRGCQDNGLLLSALWDAAFDAGLIGFEPDWSVVVCSELSESAKTALGLMERMTLPVKFRTDTRKMYLAYHRATVFESWTLTNVS